MPIKHLKNETDEELIEKTPNSFKNCPANTDNLEQMKQWLDAFAEVVKINVSRESSNDAIKEIESRLRITIPSTLRLVYSYFANNRNILSAEQGNKIIDCRILNIEELKIEKNIAVYDFYNGEAIYETDILIYGVTLKSKYLYAIDLNKDWHLYFDRKKWTWKKDDVPLYKNFIILLVCMLITNKKNIFRTFIKGIGFTKFLDQIDEKLNGYLERFKNFEHYNHAVYYNKQYGAFGWLRGNANLLMGCDDKTFAEEMIKKYKFDKAKIIKHE
jgi:hypothetical protein